MPWFRRPGPAGWARRNVGAEPVRTLAVAGQPTRAMSRSGRTDGLPPGVTAVAGDLNRPETVREALDGVRAMFLMPGYGGQRQILADARAAGVERIVLLSGKSAGTGDTGNAVAGYLIDAETAVRGSGLPWTLLRPTSFMSNALQLADQISEGDEVRVPFPDVRRADIDPHDIAQVALRALLSDEYTGRALELTGPEALLPADRVRILGEALGREPAYRRPRPRGGTRRAGGPHAEAVRRRLLQLLRRRHPGRVGGPADGAGGHGPGAAHVRAVGSGHAEAF